MNDGRVQPLEHTITENAQGATSAETTVVLVHGFPDNASVWAPTAHHLVQKGFRVICIALPGFEENAQGTTPPTFDDTIARLYATLKNTEACGATLVGHDWGAILLYRLVQRHPDAAGRLVTLEVGAAPRSLLLMLFVLCYHTLLNLAHAMGSGLGDRLMRGLCALFPRPNYPNALQPKAHHGWLYRQAWREGSTSGPWPFYFRNEIANWTPDPSLPFLFVYGKNSPRLLRFHSPAWRQAITSHCTESRQVGVAGNHWFFLENPDAFHGEIDGFLQGSPQDPSQP